MRAAEANSCLEISAARHFMTTEPMTHEQEREADATYMQGIRLACAKLGEPSPARNLALGAELRRILTRRYPHMTELFRSVGLSTL
jgi:hypothetical protein